MPKKKKTDGKKSAYRGMASGKGVINPIVAGVAGAAVGASVGVAASAALSNKDNRKKVSEVINTVRKQAVQVMENMNAQGNIEEGKKVAKKVIGDTTKKIGKKMSNEKPVATRSHAHA